MKIKLFKVCTMLISSLITSSMINAMDLKEVSCERWVNVLKNNGILSPKAEQCAALLPIFLQKNPKSDAELSTLRTKPPVMQSFILQDLCTKLMEASQKGEL